MTALGAGGERVALGRGASNRAPGPIAQVTGKTDSCPSCSQQPASEMKE